MLAPRRRQACVPPSPLASPAPAGGGTRDDSPADDVLLARIGRGDTAAFALFYDRYCAAAYGLAAHLVGETEAARAAVEDAFLGVWRAPDRWCRVDGTARTSLLVRVSQAACGSRLP